MKVTTKKYSVIKFNILHNTITITIVYLLLNNALAWLFNAEII